ncbi:response regulator transcription factor [Hahella aquimaris]|uniref:response regulator n=1 Tax=Hahella sp. HNIBRBA332 TaxID=3015983 RepID=UPI00273B6E4D|nr:response regulator transcription factor [Hahella sp. HNIBRBA332]WLQ17412.1 response regulator transcription factor [Hahella sp. HNIBRBA332]
MSLTATQPRILVIDDEPQILRFLRISLRSEGYEVLQAGSATEGLMLAATETPDAIVLDLGLPDLDGQEALKQLRRTSRTPVLVLSVRSSEAEKVEALDNGANDYVTKPFGIREFVARIRVLLRDRDPTALRPSAGIYRSAGLIIDFVKRSVTLDGEDIHLSKKEYALLARLAATPDHVVTQQQLLAEIWGPTHTEDTHYLRIVVAKLRNKLGDAPSSPRFLVTEQGVGYRLITYEAE